MVDNSWHILIQLDTRTTWVYCRMKALLTVVIDGLRHDGLQGAQFSTGRRDGHLEAQSHCIQVIVFLPNLHLGNWGQLQTQLHVSCSNPFMPFYCLLTTGKYNIQTANRVQFIKNEQPSSLSVIISSFLNSYVFTTGLWLIIDKYVMSDQNHIWLMSCWCRHFFSAAPGMVRQ